MLLVLEGVCCTRKERKQECKFLTGELIIFCPYRRDSSILSMKTVRTGFAVFRFQKPKKRIFDRCAAEFQKVVHSTRVPDVYCKGKKLDDRYVNRKHTPLRFPRVKLKLALLDELAKQSKEKSKMSAKNKRNISSSSLVLDFCYEWQGVARYRF